MTSAWAHATKAEKHEEAPPPSKVCDWSFPKVPEAPETPSSSELGAWDL